MTTTTTTTAYQIDRDTTFAFLDAVLNQTPGSHVITAENGEQAYVLTGLGPNGCAGLALEAQEHENTYVITALFRHSDGDVDVHPMGSIDSPYDAGTVFAQLVESVT